MTGRPRSLCFVKTRDSVTLLSHDAVPLDSIMTCPEAYKKHSAGRERRVKINLLHSANVLHFNPSHPLHQDRSTGHPSAEADENDFISALKHILLPHLIQSNSDGCCGCIAITVKIHIEPLKRYSC